MKQKICLGIDIGGTLTKAVGLNANSEFVHTLEVPSEAGVDPRAVIQVLVNVVREYEAKNFELIGIGIGCAGSIDSKNGVVRNSPNFKNWNRVPLKTSLLEYFPNKEITVDNDANCAAFAEWKVGSGKGLENFVLLTLGTGIGGGIIIDNQLFRGATGNAAELGHLSLYPNGVKCPCGNIGCFERYCSASALRDQFNGEYSAREIFQSAHENPRFEAAVKQFIIDFQHGLTTLANIFDPEAILIGGGVAKGVSKFFPQILSWIKAHAFPAIGENLKLMTAKHSQYSGAMGSALIVASHCEFIE